MNEKWSKMFILTPHSNIPNMTFKIFKFEIQQLAPYIGMCSNF